MFILYNIGMKLINSNWIFFGYWGSFNLIKPSPNFKNNESSLNKCG